MFLELLEFLGNPFRRVKCYWSDYRAIRRNVYLLTGFHGLHVFVGILLQMLMLARSFIPGNYNKSHFGVSATFLFWHFVDAIWVILFSLLYLWQS